ncbi:hypothetical protein [Streptomyces sp. NPDC002537]
MRLSAGRLAGSTGRLVLKAFLQRQRLMKCVLGPVLEGGFTGCLGHGKN